MIVEKVRDLALDGFPLGTVLIWRGEWARSPEDCWERERDPIPVLYHFGGRPAPSACADDWAEVVTGYLLEDYYWRVRAARRLLERGHWINPVAERFLGGGDRIDREDGGFEEDGDGSDPAPLEEHPTVDDFLDWLGERLLEDYQDWRDRGSSPLPASGPRH
jgi:hypothetical protein